jgi:hypothetical protein
VQSKTMSYYDVVTTTLETTTDHRLLTPEEHAALVWYAVYAFDEHVNLNVEWTGCSFSQKDGSVLMVSRREEQGIPQVAFITGRTTTDCIRIFRRRWAEGTLEWFRDKFR